jgi:hypothetical protein
MIDSRLARLKHADDQLKHALKHNFDSLSERALVMVDMLLDISRDNPLPATNKQHLAEAFYCQMFARDLIKDLPLFLHREGAFEDIYRVVNDPAALGASIAWALVANPDFSGYEELQQVLKKSLELGGVFSSAFPGTVDRFSDPREARMWFRFPPLDQVKMLVSNQINNEWAIEPNAEDQYRYSQFLGFLIAYVADHEPEWSLDILLQHQDRLAKIFEINLFNTQNPDIRAVGGCLHTCQSEKLLTELHRRRPDYYDQIMSTQYMGRLLLQMVATSPDFKVAQLPAHAMLSKPMLIAMFTRCAWNNSLSTERLEDLDAAFKKNGFPGHLIRDSLKSKHFDHVSRAMKGYSEMLKVPDYGIGGSGATEFEEDQDDFISTVISDSMMVGDNYLLLDSLKNKPGSRISDSPVALDNHTAYLFEFDRLPLNSLENTTVTGALLGVVVRKLQQKPSDSEKKMLVGFVQKVLDNKCHHPALAKLSHDLLHSALSHFPDLDRNMLRKINWRDRAIKGEMLTEDLGM